MSADTTASPAVGHGQEGRDKGKDFVIVVNGTEYRVPAAAVSYEQVVALAFPTPPTPDTVFTVAFRKAHDPKEGSLSAAMTVEVKKKGTVFNVKATGKS